jgi:hypothetical protein
VTIQPPTEAPLPLPEPQITEDFLREKGAFLTDIQSWPLTANLDYLGWLDNFHDDEKEVARELLHAFCYFNETWIRSTFVSCFQALSRTVTAEATSFADRREVWRRFWETVLFTFIEKEDPTVTASGYSYARLARLLLPVDPSRIGDPDTILQLLIDTRPTPVVFVDDFAGTGLQANVTWRRQRILPSGVQTSFERYAAATGAPAFFIPLICNHTARANVELCKGLTLSAGHLLSSRYSAFGPDSIIWSQRTRAVAEEVLKQVSERAGIPDLGGEPGDWRGFHMQGLAIAFAGSPPPDAVLPLFTWTENNWKPLIRM